MNSVKALGLMGVLATALWTLPSIAQSEQPRSVLVGMRPVEKAEEFKPHVGLILGLSNPNGAHPLGSEYGLDIGFQPYVPFSLGAELSHSEISASRTRDALTRTHFLLKGSYNFGGSMALINRSYVGIALGGGIENGDGRLISGPLVGFDIPIYESAEGERYLEKVSLGANAKYLIYEGSSPDTFSLTALAKAWF